MADAVSFIGGAVGLISGYVYQFVLSLAMGIASGDREEIIRVIVSLLAVWVSFVLLLRSWRLIWWLVRKTIQLVLITICFIVAINVYQRGADVVARDVSSYVHKWVQERLPEVATLSSTLSLYENIARKHIFVLIDHAQNRAVETFEQVRRQYF